MTINKIRIDIKKYMVENGIKAEFEVYVKSLVKRKGILITTEIDKITNEVRLMMPLQTAIEMNVHNIFTKRNEENAKVNLYNNIIAAYSTCKTRSEFAELFLELAEIFKNKALLMEFLVEVHEKELEIYSYNNTWYRRLARIFKIIK